MKDKNKKDSGKGGRKKKYVPPTFKVSGNLLSAPDNIWVNIVSLCCLTQRLELARQSRPARQRLVADVAKLVAG